MCGLARRAANYATSRCYPRFVEPDRDAILKALEQDKVELPSLSSKLFFDLLWRNTEEGYFADPMYGGNRDKIGWKLIGFPGGAASDYAQHMEEYNVPYRHRRV